MAIADIAGSGDEDLFDVEDTPNENELQAGAQLAMDFRDEQLRRIQEEALTMDDLDDVPVMRRLHARRLYHSDIEIP